MIIKPFSTGDIALFLELSTSENWITDRWEFDFLLSCFPDGCFTAQDASGITTGFVTSLKHGLSGWIGNLIVAKQFRGRGIGDCLFKNALESLRKAGTKTIWLTASQAGTPLYEKYGFIAIDTINRWVGTGRQRFNSAPFAMVGCDSMSGSSQDLDASAWGDHRTALLKVTTQRGMLVQQESGFIARQPCRNDWQLGPFSTVDSKTAEHLFDTVVRNHAFRRGLVVDAPDSNRAARRLFHRRNMRITGSTVLMYAGKKPAYRPELLYGLATMGSCG